MTVKKKVPVTKKKVIVLLDKEKDIIQYWQSWPAEIQDLVDTMRHAPNRTMEFDELLDTLVKENSANREELMPILSSSITKLEKLNLMETKETESTVE
jgi:hypothetical protein